MKPINPPVKNATYRANAIPGKPRKRPKRKDNLTSPKPIPFPLVIKNIIKKNAKAPTAEIRCVIMGSIRLGYEV
jgi:hypothetical protein